MVKCNLDIKVGIHATNISGIGAINLVSSLLPELEKNISAGQISIFLTPNKSINYTGQYSSTKIIIQHRFLPNSISRFFECLFPPKKFNGFDFFIVLGDIPLRFIKRQIVYVHQPHLISPQVDKNSSKKLKYIILRFLFKVNLKFTSCTIVQTDSMREKLIASYDSLSNKTFVIKAPAPIWFSGFVREPRSLPLAQGLRLFYPAAYYPHKNHKLLSAINLDDSYSWPIKELVLTIDEANNPSSNVSWIKCVGILGSSECLNAYKKADALLFLSQAESYGLPLVEAMLAGIPIVCPDMDYAKSLCGEEALYFNPNDIASLKETISLLQQKLSEGWYPNWQSMLRKLPKDWGEVAREILKHAVF